MQCSGQPPEVVQCDIDLGLDKKAQFWPVLDPAAVEFYS